MWEGTYAQSSGGIETSVPARSKGRIWVWLPGMIQHDGYVPASKSGFKKESWVHMSSTYRGLQFKVVIDLRFSCVKKESLREDTPSIFVSIHSSIQRRLKDG